MWKEETFRVGGTCSEQNKGIYIAGDLTIHHSSAFVNEYVQLNPKSGQRNDGA